MRRSHSLNQRQVEVLRWIADGCPDGVVEGYSYKHTAGALHDRKLVTVTRKRGAWQAEVTDAGHHYLEHGTYAGAEAGKQDAAQPAERKVAREQAASRATSPTRPVTPKPPGLIIRRRRAATELVERLIERGGLTLDGLSDAEIVEQRKVIETAKRYGLIPDGKRIQTHKLYDGRLSIRLYEGLHANAKQETEQDLAPVVVPARLHNPHPVVRELRDDPGRLLMPKLPQVRNRALRILQAVAAEAVRRGYRVVNCPVDERYVNYYMARGGGPRYKRREGQLRVVIDGLSYVVDIRLERPETDDPERAQALILSLPIGRNISRSSWADRKRTTVEDGIAALLRELELRAERDRQEAIEAERARAERKVRWEAAMVEARAQASQAHYAAVLGKQIERWTEARRIRDYAVAVEDRIRSAAASGDDPAVVEAAGEWLAWMTAYANDLDPLERLVRMPAAPQINDHELGPFLKGWSVYGPEGRRSF